MRAKGKNQQPNQPTCIDRIEGRTQAATTCEEASAPTPLSKVLRNSPIPLPPPSHTPPPPPPPLSPPPPPLERWNVGTFPTNIQASTDYRSYKYAGLACNAAPLLTL